MPTFMPSGMARTAILAIGLCLLGTAQAQQKPPAGRSGLDPASCNKVANVMARSYMEEDLARSRVNQETQSVTGPSGRSCATNIGTQPNANGRNGAGGRYGTANSDQVIVVRGPVVNVCK